LPGSPWQLDDTTCASVQSLAGSADGADGAPGSLGQIYFSRPGTSLTAAASGPGGLVIRRVTSAGIRRVHDRYITSPRQVHDRLSQIQSLTGDCGKPLRHDAAARTASRSAGSVAHHGAVPSLPPGSGRRAPGHRLRGSLEEMARADTAACPGRRGEQDPARRPSRAERRRTGCTPCTACTSQASSPAPRVTGQNGRGSAKQAVPRTACFARTLSAICP
jgi:hypothetical protein